MEMDSRIYPFFKGLTHLAVEGGQADARSIAALLTRKSLKVFVLWFAFPSGTELDEETARIYHLSSRHIHDTRAVSIQRHRLNDWQTGTRGGRDMWAVAEHEIEKRNQNALLR